MAAKVRRDFTIADEVRQLLLRLGIEINDGARTWTLERPELVRGAAESVAASGARILENSYGFGDLPSREADVSAMEWFYIDAHGTEQGPFALTSMRQWFRAGYFSAKTAAGGGQQAKRGASGHFLPIAEIAAITGNVGQDGLISAERAAAQAEAAIAAGANAGKMSGAAAQEAVRGRERFAGPPAELRAAVGVAQQEALLAKARALEEAEAAEAAAAGTAAEPPSAEGPSAAKAAKPKKKKANKNFLGSLKQQVAKTSAKKASHKHKKLDEVAKQGAGPPVYWQQ